jgi:hypothetical protein
VLNTLHIDNIVNSVSVFSSLKICTCNEDRDTGHKTDSSCRSEETTKSDYDYNGQTH